MFEYLFCYSFVNYFGNIKIPFWKLVILWRKNTISKLELQYYQVAWKYTFLLEMYM